MHGNDKVAPEPHKVFPINTSEAFALQRTMINGESSVHQNSNVCQSSVHNSGLATTSHVGMIDTDLSMNLHGNVEI